MDNRKPTPTKTQRTAQTDQEKSRSLRLKTRVRAGDCYMHNPRGTTQNP
jgi:hypothetical protein